MRWRVHGTGAAWAVVAGLALTGCGSLGPDTTGAVDTARSFHRAVSAGDGARACALLSPRTAQALRNDTLRPCRRAVTEQDLPPGGTVRNAQVYGHNGRVVMQGDTVFVSRFDHGWRVIGAGCRFAGPGRPYECDVAGD